MAHVEPTIQTFLSDNAKFASTYKKPFTMEQLRAKAHAAGGGFIILTCVDPRSAPEHFFGPSFSAAVIRNGGGRASADVIKSITLLRTLMNDVAAVLVVHHTDCGATHVTEADLRADVKRRTPDAAVEETGEPYGCFAAEDFEATIREDVETLRGAKVLAGVQVRGFALETETGVVREVEG